MSIFKTSFEKFAKLKSDVQLENHQKRVEDKLKDTKALLLYHSLGSGKTLSAINAAGDTKTDFVVPASLRENAKKELKKFFGLGDADTSTDQYMKEMGVKKTKLNDQFLELLRRAAMDSSFRKGFEKNAVEVKRRKYREIDIDTTDDTNDDEIWSAKIDGAHAVIELKKGEYPRVFGHRISKKTNEPIEYTDKLPGLKQKSPIDAVVRGELYITQNGVVQPPEVVTSVLNSNVDRSIDLQRRENYTANLALFDVDYYKKDRKKVDQTKKVELLNRVAKKFPLLTLPDIATTQEEKKQLLESIRAKKHPQTEEGIVIYKGNNYIKAKTFMEHDVYIRSIFNEVSATRAPMAGGFEYSWTATGPIAGKVGSGFDFATKKDMYDHPEKYIGKVAKVRALSISANKALMKPSYQGLHVDKNIG